MRSIVFLFVFLSWVSPVQASTTILVMGDSLSAAYNIAIEEGWVSLLDRRLDALGCDVELVNGSITGETSIGGLTRLPKLLQTHQPTIVMIELGGNDGLRGFPPSELRKNLSRMVELSRDAGAGVVLLGIQIPTNYGRRYTESLAEVYPSLAEEYQLPLVPFFLEGVADDESLMQSDGIHPNSTAQPVLVENVFPLVTPMLESCSLSQSPDSP